MKKLFSFLKKRDGQIAGLGWISIIAIVVIGYVGYHLLQVGKQVMLNQQNQQDQSFNNLEALGNGQVATTTQVNTQVQ
ncbi:MAG: hypothetical protein KGI60_02895 [Patescibacteria group bacterium]|nr:hypothetical protein [Patescibacteria group bacterium]